MARRLALLFLLLAAPVTSGAQDDANRTANLDPAVSLVSTPPRDTDEGARGRRFVREQLATARTLVVSTRKYDIHRRYVAHVFYAFNKRGIEHTFLNGRYLNQELVNKGFAKLV